MARILENASEWELWGMRGESGGGIPLSEEDWT